MHAITGAIQGTPKPKLYNELRLKTLNKRRRRSKLFFHKILIGFLSKYLYLYLILPSQENYHLRSALSNKINVIPSRT